MLWYSSEHYFTASPPECSQEMVDSKHTSQTYLDRRSFASCFPTDLMNIIGVYPQENLVVFFPVGIQEHCRAVLAANPASPESRIPSLPSYGQECETGKVTYCNILCRRVFLLAENLHLRNKLFCLVFFFLLIRP